MKIFPASQTFQFGESRFWRGGRYQPAFRNYFDVVILYAGGVVIEKGEEKHELPVGQVTMMYHDSPVTYCYKDGQETHCRWCNTLEAFDSLGHESWFEKLPVSVPISQRLEALIDLGVGILPQEDTRLLDECNALGEAVFYEFFHQADLLSDEKPMPNTILRAKRYIEEHYRDTIDLGKIADVAGLERQHLSKRFRQFIGQTPTQYLWQMRSDQGVKMLTTTHMSVSEIAYHCGFSSPYHFSRYIKQRHNFSPSELRKRQVADRE